MARRRAGRGDSRMFARTASRSKKINVVPVSYRGGIRF